MNHVYCIWLTYIAVHIFSNTHTDVIAKYFTIHSVHYVQRHIVCKIVTADLSCNTQLQPITCATLFYAGVIITPEPNMNKTVQNIVYVS